MRYITGYRLLAVGLIGMLSLSIAGRAQAPQAQLPQAKVRELATIEGDVRGFVHLPSGRALIYSAVADGDTTYAPRVEDSTFTYNIATKRRTLLGTNMLPGSVSAQGDRLAFTRSSEDRTGSFVWTMPIDPQTGIATGQAQRVSLRPVFAGSPGQGGRANFSPDGRMLGFWAGPRPNGTWDLTLVPATGGVERVVANQPRVGSWGWNADGSSLYLEPQPSSPAPWPNPRTKIERVPVAGGRSEPLFPRTHRTDGNTVGLSSDAHVVVNLRRPDRFFYRTASGVEGEIEVPLPALDDGWGYNFTLDSRGRYATATILRNQEVRVLDLPTGQARSVLPSEHSSAPAWSPDGRRLAVLIGNGSHYDIGIVNADGSGVRRYPLRLHLNGWGSPMPWSPDGRFLAFNANDRREVGGDSVVDEDQLALLDVTSGETRVLATMSPGIFGGFVWRSDGKAILARRSPLGLTPLEWRTNIIEIDLGGTERLLRDISPEFREPTRIAFAGDREVVLAVRLGQETDRFLVPLDGGTARRLRQLPDPSGEPRLPAPLGTPIAGNRLLVAQRGGDARDPGVPVISILSTSGDSMRSVRLPTGTVTWSAHPDGEHVVVAVAAAGESVSKIFLVPLDGEAPRLAGEIRRTGDSLAISPDGKLLAYTSPGRVTSKIHEVDFGPALQAIMNR